MKRRKFLSTFSSFFVATKFMSCTGAQEELCPVYDSETGWQAALPEGDNLRNNPAFAFVKNDPKLPRILLIGDSISIGYTPYAREILSKRANVHRIPDNSRDTASGLEKLVYWLGKRKWDVIHFNWGLHDLKYIKDDKLDLNGIQVRSVDSYAQNLEQIVQHLDQTKANLIWASTTPIPEGSSGRIPGDEIRYNDAAEKIMKIHNVPVNDLYSTVKSHLSKYQRPKNVHFTAEGSEYLGRKVVKEILNFI
jgi:acyl-CoA thioesterase-1